MYVGADWISSFISKRLARGQLLDTTLELSKSVKTESTNRQKKLRDNQVVVLLFNNNTILKQIKQHKTTFEKNRTRKRDNLHVFKINYMYSI